MGFSGMDFEDWGAALVVNFKVAPGGVLQPYDVTSYSGISFYARADAPITVQVLFPDSNTTPVGNVCGAETTPCYDHYRYDVTLSNVWQKYRIPFSSLQHNGGSPAFEKAMVYSIQFAVDGEAPFHFWIDDVAFTQN
jgi:hypothetical protein